MHIRPPTGDRPYIFMSLIFQLCLNILQYYYDIVINNIYTHKSVSLKPICLDAAYGRPVCNRKLVISYTYLQ